MRSRGAIPLLMAALVWGVASDLRADSPYARALLAGSKGAFVDARQLILEAVSADPQDIAARRAQDLLADQQVGFVNDAAARLLFKGIALSDRAEWHAAAAACRDALDQDPGYFLALHNLGTMLYQTGDTGGAIAALREALTRKDDYPYTHNNLGLAYARLGRHQQACAELRRAIELFPGYHKAYNNLATSLFALGKDEEADATLRQALAIKPDYALAAANLDSRTREGSPSHGASSRALLEALEYGGWDERAQARDEMMARPDPGAADRLVTLLGHARPEVRGAAARVLGGLKGAAALDALAARLLTDADWTVRFEAAWALSQLADERALEPLAKALREDRDDHVRRSAAHALQAYAGCGSARALQRALGDPVSDVRANALRSLQSSSGQPLGPAPAGWNAWVSATCLGPPQQP